MALIIKVPDKPKKTNPNLLSFHGDSVHFCDWVMAKVAAKKVTATVFCNY